MKKLVLFSLILFMVSFQVIVIAQNRPLVSNMEAMLVKIDEGGEEFFTPVEGEVYPGDIILYRLTYENTGDEVLQNLKPVGPVPDDTEYVQDSAKSSVDAGLEFSIDGGESYSSPPVMYKKLDLEGKEIEAEATPDMYTHVRWTVRYLKIGEKITLEYRVQVR